MAFNGCHKFNFWSKDLSLTSPTLIYVTNSHWYKWLFMNEIMIRLINTHLVVLGKHDWRIVDGTRQIIAWSKNLIRARIKVLFLIDMS